MSVLRPLAAALLAVAAASASVLAVTAQGAPATAAALAPAISGRFVQGALLLGQAAPGAQVSFNGRPLRVAADGRFAFGLHRDDGPAAELSVRWADGTQTRHEYAIERRDYAVQRIDGLPQAMVTPPAAVQERIAREQAQVGAARAFDTDLPVFARGFRRPVEARVTGVYGSQRILNGEPKQPHYGLDLAAPAGTPVHASAAGIVRLAERDLYYTGGTVIVDHGHGVSSTYLHLSKVLVAPEQAVAAGAVIGEVGATGRATGPHLCFRYNWFDARLDPELVLAAFPSKEP